MLYKIDTGLLAELRAHEQQAAQELSQWQTKTVLLAWGRTEALRDERRGSSAYAVRRADYFRVTPTG